MLSRICYLGDDTLQGAAAYLAGIMSHFGLPYEHVASTDSPDEDFASQQYALYVVSDYPAARFRPGQMEHLIECVAQGSGLVMLGGWESFHGRLGEYHGSPLARALPVVMANGDDRRNCAQPCLIHKLADHPILEGLPWDTPPGIGGFNAIAPKPDATTVLSAARFSVCRKGEEFQFTRGAEAPLLVVGQCGSGRTAALATDVAPHWVGGLVDWGDQRVVQEVAGAWIEVGNWYARFFRNLLAWAGRMEAEANEGEAA
jgi:uncharacterized membrane protein